MLEWDAASSTRDLGKDDTDDPPPEVLGLLAGLALQDGGGEIQGEDGNESLRRSGQVGGGPGGAVMGGH